MKKVLFLAALLLVCFSGVTNAQTRKQREDAKREAWKKERQEKKALEAQQDSVSYVQAINACKLPKLAYLLACFFPIPSC